MRALGVDPADAGFRAFGDAPPVKESQIAFGNGIMFEQGLTRDDGARLFDMFCGAGRLLDGDTGFVNVERLAPGADPASQSRREAITRQLLARKLAGAADAPKIIWHARLTLFVDGNPVVIEPDVLSASARDAFYRPGEAKSYRDRGPRTNPSDIATASLQGAIEVLALREVVTSLTGNAVSARTLVGDSFDLILRRRIGNTPRLRTRVIRREIASMERVLGHMRGRVLRVLATLPSDASVDTSAGHLAVPNHLTEGCRAHCALAHRCALAARAVGDPIILGSAMADAMGVVGSLPRLIDLLHGRAVPASPDEMRVVRTFRDAQGVLDQEVRRAG